jgi:hypothetical protein
MVNDFGGMDAMKKVCMTVSNRDSGRGRNLESSWDGIGDWMG